MNTDDKLGRGYYSEALDRVHCVREMISVLIEDHPVMVVNPEIKSAIVAAQYALGKAYQLIGLKEQS